MLNAGTTVTPTSVQYQSPGDIKTILTDNNPDTFSHSELKPNQYLKVDFDKPHTIVQIRLRNRPTSTDRILNVQFRLYNDAIVNDEMIYESNKITVDQQLYYILPLDKTIYTGEAPAMSVMTAPDVNKESVTGRKLRIGFFDSGKKQFLHLASIRIINTANLDIAKDSTFTQTSYWPGYGTESDLKSRLIDQDIKTFNHTSNEANQYLTIDFGKNESIKHIIVENRDSQYARLLDAQVKLYDENDKVVFISDKVTTSEQYYLLNLPSRSFVPSLIVGAIILTINALVAAATMINDAKKKAEEAKILADKAKAETDAKNAEAARIKAEADAAALAAVEAQMKAEADALAAKTAAEKKAADEKKAIADKEAADALAIQKAADEVKAQAELQAKAAEDAKKAAEAQIKVAEEKEKLKKAQEAKEAAEKLAAENPTPDNQAKVAELSEVVAVIEQTKTQAEEIQKEADEKAKVSLDVALKDTPTPPPPPAPVATLGMGTIALIVVLVLTFLAFFAWMLRK
jgi:hypothetical protein